MYRSRRKQLLVHRTLTVGYGAAISVRRYVKKLLMSMRRNDRWLRRLALRLVLANILTPMTQTQQQSLIEHGTSCLYLLRLPCLHCECMMRDSLSLPILHLHLVTVRFILLVLLLPWVHFFGLLIRRVTTRTSM